MLRSAQEFHQKGINIYARLSPVQRILGVVGGVGTVVLGLLFLIYSESIFGALIGVAESWRDMTGGWLILWAITFISAFPPLIGYSSTTTIAGFVYGFPNGWFIAATSTVAGSTASFLASRTILSQYVQRLIGQDKRFEALAQTLEYDGLKILVMIRFCPLPYSLSNAAMSTFPTVEASSFALATAISSPKLLIPVFIGSRMASFGEGGASTKLLNLCSIVFGLSLGGTVGYLIYRRTMARARELEIADMENADEARAEVPIRRASYTDTAGDFDAAMLMDDDDISLWDNTDRHALGYSDDTTDDEDVFAAGDETILQK